ncbi:hypothetical protein [Candidatus Amarolinea dominans]|uniref:hypothetical protein n=1 Tax=Candidatus Amarolinea dominans TaxID=3140696 RepID=UPI0031CC8628
MDVAGLTSDVTAVSAGGAHTCALTTAGGAGAGDTNVLGQLGDGTTVQRLLPVGVVGLVSGVEAVEGGVLHTCALKHSRRNSMLGRELERQLGDGDNDQSPHTGQRDRADQRRSGCHNGLSAHLRPNYDWWGQMLG